MGDRRPLWVGTLFKGQDYTDPFWVEVGRQARGGAGQLSLSGSTFQTAFTYVPLPI
jgi:hypothetical protein